MQVPEPEQTRWLTIHWDRIDWKWLFTFLLAAYGAGLATYREVVSRLEKRANIKVKLSLDIIIIGGGGPAIPQVQVRVENHGRTDVIFNSNGVSLQVKGHNTSLFVVEPSSDVRFPFVLKPGGSYYLMKERKPLLESLEQLGLGPKVEVRAFVSDAIVRPFYSPWQSVDLDEQKAKLT